VLWNETRTLARPLPAAADGNSHYAFLELAHALGMPRRTTRALHLGCGSADLCELLAARFEHYVALDPDALALQRGKRALAGRGPNTRFVVGDDPQPDEIGGDAFDLVLCDFNRIRAGRDVLRRMGMLVRLLAPGGIAFFDVPRRRSLLAVVRGRGARRGSVPVSWPDVANEARLAQARIMWVDKAHRAGTLYCIVRGDA
jgi:SAM-dependent methyltransferase